MYNNIDGLLDSWVVFWVKIVLSFKNFFNVIGYEFINELFVGDIYVDLLFIVLKVVDRMNLGFVYEVLSKVIRKYDDKYCIFFEGVIWDDFGVGFNSVLGGDEYCNRSVFSYYYYILLLIEVIENFEV